MVIALVVISTTACAPQMYKNYASEKLRSSEHAVLSSLYIDKIQDVKLQVTEIDARKINVTTAAGFYLLAGEHVIKVKATTTPSMGISPVSGGSSVNWKQANLVVTNNFEKDHTYFPIVRRSGDSVMVSFLDKGRGYPENCLPLFQEAYYESHRRAPPVGGCK